MLIVLVDDEDNEADIMKAFTEAVEEEIANQGEITRKLAHSIFIGPPGSGKSSLIYFLLNGKPKEGFSPSTGACKYIIVDIKMADSLPVLHPVTMSMDSDAWNEVADYELSLLLQMTQKSLPTSDEHKLEAESSESSDEDITPESEHVVDLQPQLTDPSPISLNLTPQNRSSTAAASNPLSTSEEEPISVAAVEMFKRINIHDIIKNKYGTIKNYLQRTSSLYMRDTGGHIEFQEMMPLTLFGPSLFFFVFRADQNLQDTFDVHYRISSSESLNPYRSSLTIEDALLQCLASIRAIDVPGEESIKMHKSLVFIVGTHIDQIKPSINDKITLLNQQIHSLIEKNNFSDLVLYSGDKDHVIFPVNNMSSSDEHFKLIRSKVNRLIWGHEDFNIKFPTTYLLVCLELQNVKKNILSLGEFKDIAARCGIKGDKVFHLLRFLHFRVGVIRYYDAPGLRDIVVVQPQILFSIITDLVIQTYSSECLFPKEHAEFKKRGIISKSVCKRVLKGDDSKGTSQSCIFDSVNSKKFFRLLEHLRIITPFTTHEDTEKKYFIPFVLSHVPESGGDDFLVTNISPLVIKFKCCHTPKGAFSSYHCPKGVFGVLITHLMRPDSANQRNSNTTFSLVHDHIYRDQVLFEVHSLGAGARDRISLRYCCSHLEVLFFPDASDYRNLAVGAVCQNIREIMVKSIHESLKTLNYSAGRVNPVMCFECCIEGCSDKHPINKVCDVHLFYCNFTKTTNRLPEGARYWYNEGKYCT